MPQERPNILLITSDQQHYDTLGLDNALIKTPALDRLGRQGTVFTRAYCNNPTCTPSRATLITGMYPSHHGAWSLGTKLLESVPTLGDVLQEHGYATSLVGKAHLHPVAGTPQYPSIECHPTLRDLDFWRGFHGPWYGFQNVETARMHGNEHLVGGHYALWMQEQGLHNWLDYFGPYPVPAGYQRPTGAWNLPERYHYNVWTAERAIELMRRDVGAGRPFFTWASFHDPHPPYLVPEPWASMYDPAAMSVAHYADGEFDDKPPHFAMTRDPRADWSVYQETEFYNHGFLYQVTPEADLRRYMAIYYGMVSFMDQQIGRILAALDEMGVVDNTIVVFTTDHGHLLGQHGLVEKAGHLYEDLLRLPFIVRWPGAVPAGRRCAGLQALVDLPQTFLAAAGIPAPGVMQGVSQLGVWRGDAGQARDHVIVEHRHQPTKIHMRSFITERFKMTWYRDQAYGELYDLEADPGELVNHWSDPGYASVRAALFEKLAHAEMHREPMPMPRIANA